VALAAGEAITAQLVQRHVGDWRARSAWEMVDAAADGDARTALAQLDRLLSAGEDLVGVLAQIASTLRRYATATRLVLRHEQQGKRIPLRSALEQAGQKAWKLDEGEKRLRQIGRERGNKLHRCLLEADLAIKGASSAPLRARLVLEQLIVRLSTSAAAQSVRA